MTLLKDVLTLGAAAVTCAAIARAVLRRSRRFSFSGRTVLVTGGSRGLGLALARQLIDKGAKVAICARTVEDLESAERELQARGGDVLSLRCDVTKPDEVRAMVRQVVERFGGVDVLCNVAGVIQVGPLESMTRDDFRLAMEAHFWGPLNTVLEVLPHMRGHGWGRIVNVASMGGKRAVPHMLPYTASKFALVGLSNGLHVELAKHRIIVTTVCPSLIRTGSARNSLYKGRHRSEYAWFSVAASMPVLSMSPEYAAARILEACQNGEREVLLRNPADLATAVQSLLPGTTQAILTAADRLLPPMGGIGTGSVRGYDSESNWSPSRLTRLSDAAARRNNEMRPRTHES